MQFLDVFSQRITLVDLSLVEPDFSRHNVAIVNHDDRNNIDFLGFVSEERKLDLLAYADGLVFGAEREDFGIVPVEAMASGTPVVSVDEGYQPYQITDGESGILHERGELLPALERLYTTDWDSNRIQNDAQPYSYRAFRQRWRRFILDD